MRLTYKTDGMPFSVYIIEEVEFPDGEYYPVRFCIECQREDDGHIEYIGKPIWSEEFYDIAQNALIRRFAESKEMKRLMDDYYEENLRNI